MTDKNQAGAIGAGVLGATLGAVAGVAVTKIMSDPKMKSKATDAFHKAKKYALDSIQQVKSKAQEMQDTGEEIVTETKKMGRSATRIAKAL